MNYSKKYKINWFTPIRTGTRATKKIMDYFKFEVSGVHDEHYNEETKDYEIIVNTHNPYKRLYSIFNLNKINIPESIFGFEFWIRNLCSGPRIPTEPPNPFQIYMSKYYYNFPKKPKHIVRVENFYEDLQKIDFIANDNSEELNEIFVNTILINRYISEENENWKSLYNQNFADFIYENFKDDFEIFGYDRNSWK